MIKEPFAPPRSRSPRCQSLDSRALSSPGNAAGLRSTSRPSDGPPSLGRPGGTGGRSEFIEVEVLMQAMGTGPRNVAVACRHHVMPCPACPTHDVRLSTGAEPWHDVGLTGKSASRSHERRGNKEWPDRYSE